MLVPLNTRLAAGDYAYILDHAEPRAIVAHPGRRELLEDALERMEGDRPRVIWSGDEYEDLLAAARPAGLARPDDERALLSINYTSGTTGRPKGVMTDAPRRLPARARRHRRGRAHRAQPVPVDAADVPLQRLGLSRGR